MSSCKKRKFSGHIVDGIYNIPLDELNLYIPEVLYLFKLYNLKHNQYSDFKLLYGKIEVNNDFKCEYIYRANKNTYCVCHKLSIDDLDLIYDS
jgi:hypothetical protein